MDSGNTSSPPPQKKYLFKKVTDVFPFTSEAKFFSWLTV